MSPSLPLAFDADPALVSHLELLLRYDRSAVVRLCADRAAGSGLSVFGSPPFGVVSWLRVPLAEPVDVDTTVAVGPLLAAVTTGGPVRSPDPVTGPPWTGLLPPTTGWQPLAELASEDVVRQVLAGVAEFRARWDGLGPEQRSSRVGQQLADEIWGRALTAEVAELPLRAGHAAHAFGLLRPGEPVRLSGVGRWWLLTGTDGSVAVRRPGGLRLA